MRAPRHRDHDSSSDCLIAAFAMRHGAAVCATDPHFANIPGLELFRAR
jgi:predicted nucleic acid-binding protein